MVVVIGVVNAKAHGNHIQKGLARREISLGSKVFTHVKGPLVDAHGHFHTSSERRPSIQAAVVIGHEGSYLSRRLGW